MSKTADQETTVIRTALIFTFFLAIGVLDCYITNYALKGGATEANPLMASAQTHGVLTQCKLAATVVAAVAACLLDFLGRKRKISLARYGLAGLVVFYLCLGVYQVNYYHTLASLEQQRLEMQRIGQEIRLKNHLDDGPTPARQESVS